MTVPLHHPVTGGHTDAVNERQAALFESRGWVRDDAPEPESAAEAGSAPEPEGLTVTFPPAHIDLDDLTSVSGVVTNDKTEPEEH